MGWVMEKGAEGNRCRRQGFRCSMSPFTLWSLSGDSQEPRWGHVLPGCSPPAPAIRGGRQLKPKAATSLWDVPEGKGQNLLSPLRPLVTFLSVLLPVFLPESPPPSTQLMLGGWVGGGLALEKQSQVPKAGLLQERTQSLGEVTLHRYFSLLKLHAQKEEQRMGVRGLVSLVEVSMWYKNLVELSKSCLPLTTA